MPARPGRRPRCCAAIGAAPLQLGAKEGLALLNGTQVSTALALWGWFAAAAIFDAALLAGAMSVDAALGSDVPFDPRLNRVRGQPGQIRVAERQRALLAGSAIRASHLVDCERVQDPYSLRCQPQVMGACLDLLEAAGATLVREANGVSDNPLVFAPAEPGGTGAILSGGNFHAEPVAFAADQIALALAEIGSLAERRIALLTDPAMSGLPAFLSPEPGLNSGFMLAQICAAALASENQHLAHPVAVDSRPTSANQEDHVSMATYAARRLLEMAANAGHIVAIELLAAGQGIELRRPLETSPQLEAALAEVRRYSAFMAEDRPLAGEIEALGAAVLRRELGGPHSLDAIEQRDLADLGPPRVVLGQVPGELAAALELEQRVLHRGELGLARPAPRSNSRPATRRRAGRAGRSSRRPGAPRRPGRSGHAGRCRPARAPPRARPAASGAAASGRAPPGSGDRARSPARSGRASSC